MRIWIVMTGEALPTDGKNIRLRRAATLANLCASRGHDVTWWTSTFHHQKKQQRANADTSITTEDGVRIEMLYAPAYNRNVSVGRLVNHRILGNSLARRLQTENPPDLILCAWPTIEFSVVCVDYARANRVPVIIDVRDLWPDIFVDVVPFAVRKLMKAALYPLRNSAKYVFHNCSGIVGISPGYLMWALGYANRPRKALDAVFPLAYEKPKPADSDVAMARRELTDAGVNAAKKICWFVGVFGTTYDLATVIRAAALMQERGRDDIQFVLSGYGEKDSELRTMAGGLSNIVFTGWVDGAKISVLGEISAVGLAAYTQSAPQGLPNKLYEYMAFGLPMVSSLKGEAEEFVVGNRCGLTYQGGSPESLLSALLSLVDNRQLRFEYGTNGRHLYETELSSHKVYAAMMDYLEAAGSASRESIAAGK
jgi:glycosyltransferase involved in cell wall biosynthesis